MATLPPQTRTPKGILINDAIQNHFLHLKHTYIWTNNINHAIYLSEALEFGMVGINEWAPHATEAPFGGWKQSGIGHESGSEGMMEYMEKKLIAIGGL